MLELIWWGITALVIVGVLFPIREILGEYPFLYSNVFAIIIFLTFTRYVFQLKHSFIGKQQTIKLALILLCFPLFLFYIDCINDFQTVLDENGVEAILGDATIADKVNLGKYVRSEYIFFAVGTVIATFVFFIRLIFSVWRYRNRGTI